MLARFGCFEANGFYRSYVGGRVPAACLSLNTKTHRNLSPYRRGSRPGSAGNGFEVAVASVASGKRLFRLSGVASCAGVKDLFFNLSY